MRTADIVDGLYLALLAAAGILAIGFRALATEPTARSHRSESLLAAAQTRAAVRVKGRVRRCVNTFERSS
jgi:hypothetical protein